MDTVDKITEGKWCDHVSAKGIWLRGQRPVIVVGAPPVYIVIEDGVVKILCKKCFQICSQLQLHRRRIMLIETVVS